MTGSAGRVGRAISGFQSVAERISSGRAAALAAMADALGVERDRVLVYAGNLDTVEPPASPRRVSVVVRRATEVAATVPAEGPRPPDASSSGVHDSDFVAVATAEDAVVGWLVLRVETPVCVEDRGFALRFEGTYLWRLFVVSAHRRRGVGSTLVRSAAAFARSNHVGAAFALVETGNVSSRRLFESVGFEAVDAVTRYRLPVVGRYVPSPSGRRSYGTGTEDPDPRG